jgi:polyhydroxyalkanoate synthesis repressor PhaR
MKHDTAASQRKHTPTGGQPAPDGTVVLKKYGNRRLYDTSSSRYVTIGEVEAMVQGGTDIQVKDAKTGEDITKEILVQLLLERDSARAALPTGLLKQAVRLANSPLKEGLVKAMQEGLDTFMQSQRTIADAQRALSSQLGQLTPWLQPTTTPAALWNPFAPPAPPPPGTMTNQPLSTPVSAPAAPPSPMAPPVMPHAAATNGDVDTLRAELSQTQALVRQLLERELARDQPSAPSTSAKKAPKKAAPKAATAKKAAPAKATARKR